MDDSEDKLARKKIKIGSWIFFIGGAFIAFRFGWMALGGLFQLIGILGILYILFTWAADWEIKNKVNRKHIGWCPHCTKKINLFATKCPYCTADL